MLKLSKQWYQRRVRGGVPARGLMPNDAVLLTSHACVHCHLTTACFGTVYLTKYQLIFEPSLWIPLNQKGRPQPQSCEAGPSTCCKQGLRVPLATVAKITTTSGFSRLVGKYRTFELTCKDFNDVRFSYLLKNATGADPASTITAIHKIPDNNFLYAFCNRGPCGTHNGWELYNHEKEFQRMGIPSAEWRLSYVNSDYKASPTYPPTPATATATTTVATPPH
eukprot:TRINITY_DN3538_c0_g1_i6.p1 TRINITY_DN3538_c0_g1~~TRINITY_DN3538_c0_g1_i6.p1  ORF type:complete len:222 (-),score=82.43 TRINITY_DN3538_c0_g1_i6:148-813(-)